MLKKIKFVRVMLIAGLLFSVLFTSYSMYYKIKTWGFNFAPKKSTDVWTVEAQISFIPTGDPIYVSIARPVNTPDYKILDEDIIARNYVVEKSEERIEILSKPRRDPQDLYYRVLLYDNVESRGKTASDIEPKAKAPIMDDASKIVANHLIELAKEEKGDEVQQIIRLISQGASNKAVSAFMPERRSDTTTVEAIGNLLALKGIPSRIIRGIKLAEGKKTFSPDVMIEVYIRGMWRIYNIETGNKGVPKSFVVFQRGGNSLIDVTGGYESAIKFSVMKSVRSSFGMAGHRAKLADDKSLFDYSIYNLPLNQQNALKWLMIFPLAILVVVIMRNVVGIPTMGTFTPMLISMALVEAGFWYGLVCFTMIISIGILIRAMLSKLNLLLVPRISAVVIFVIIIIQVMAIVGYQMKWEIASSALFFPIIIMAWIIERASITWEEDGAANATKEIIYSILVAIITYFVIMNEYIRHIMFAFNEINLIILFLVMLLGTYTGYRITELIRFAPLVKKDK